MNPLFRERCCKLLEILRKLKNNDTYAIKVSPNSLDINRILNSISNHMWDDDVYILDIYRFPKNIKKFLSKKIYSLLYTYSVMSYRCRNTIFKDPKDLSHIENKGYMKYISEKFSRKKLKSSCW